MEEVKQLDVKNSCGASAVEDLSRFFG